MRNEISDIQSVIFDLDDHKTLVAENPHMILEGIDELTRFF